MKETSLLSIILVTAIVAITFIFMFAIANMFLKELRKKDADRFVVLRESFTTHLLMSILLGLLCKAFIIDAFVKDELK